MDYLEILGYIASLLVGFSLGLIGGGGSILAVPIFVYIFELPVLISTSYSLFTVAIISWIGTFKNFKTGSINFKNSIYFLLFSLASVFLTRYFLLPAIPDEIIILDFSFTKNFFILIVFSSLMILSGVTMIIQKKGKTLNQASNIKLSISGIIIGTLTAGVGAGGGFLIVPTLYLFGGLDMKKAISTSLFLIAANSTIGFLSDLSIDIDIDFYFILIFTSIAIIGLFIGIYIKDKIAVEKLKKGFGYFVLLIGILMFINEIINSIYSSM